MDGLKTFIKPIIGFLTLYVFALCAIGCTGTLIYNGSYLFAISTVVVCCFAYKPIFKFFQKSTL